MSKRTIRILILLAAACAVLLVVAAPGTARRGGDDDRDRIRGTVASFTNGVLTIRQSNGDEVEGKVDRRTEIECERRNSRSTAVAAHDGDDDHGGRGRDHDEDDDDDHHRGRGRDDDHHRGRHHDRRRCSARLLTAGRAVREADLLSTSSGPVFREVEIVG